MGAVLNFQPRRQAVPLAVPMARETIKPAPMTAANLAMYSMLLDAIMNMGAMAVEARDAEHSHELANVTLWLDAARGNLGCALAAMYQAIEKSPLSSYPRVNEQRRALVELLQVVVSA